jgi:hypothetical protein
MDLIVNDLIKRPPFLFPPRGKRFNSFHCGGGKGWGFLRKVNNYFIVIVSSKKNIYGKDQR